MLMMMMMTIVVVKGMVLLHVYYCSSRHDQWQQELNE